MLDYNLEPDQYLVLDLDALTADEIKDLAYFIWCMFRDHANLMEWRRSYVLPRLAPIPAEELHDDY